MGSWDTKLSARTVWENLCACEPRAMLGSRSPVACPSVPASRQAFLSGRNGGVGGLLLRLSPVAVVGTFDAGEKASGRGVAPSTIPLLTTELCPPAPVGGCQRPPSPPLGRAPNA